MIFDFSRLIVFSRYLQQLRDTSLVFCINNNSIAVDAIRFWTGIFNDECHLGNLVNYWLLPILKSGHGTKEMP